MTKKMFSVYDIKAAVFSSPFTSIRNETAIRDFTNACNDPDSMLSKNPGDYHLYELAEFDDYTGVITPISPINMISMPF